MVANTVSVVRPEADHTVLTKRPVFLARSATPDTGTNARHEGWLLAKKNSPEKRLDDLIKNLSSEPVVHELTDEFMDLLNPEQITALQAKTKEIIDSGLSALESKIEMTKAMIEIVSDEQAYQIIQKMTEAMTGEHANRDQVMSVIDMYKNEPTADIVDSLVAQLDEQALETGDLTIAKQVDPILVA